MPPRILSLFTLSLLLPLSSPINVWPKPRTFSWSRPHSIPVSPRFTIASPKHKYLTPAVDRYRRLILTDKHHPLNPPVVDGVSTPSLQTLTLAPSLQTLTLAPSLKTLTLTVRDLHAPLHHGVNESYTLTVPDAGACICAALIEAETAWGAMRGLETFSQLVWGDPILIAAGVFVSDAPIFGHRGVLLDTSRSYYEVEDVLRTIAAMSWNKMNVFHWHITDSQSFPIVVPSEPKLAAKGSYGEGMRYTAEDVRRVVEFGLEHGVRVLPEIDMPAHTGSWAEAYPEIVTCAHMFWWPAGFSWADRLASEPGTGQLNPLNPKTYEVVKNVIHDVITMFPEQFYHAGADEVVSGCWKADPSIRAFLANNGTLGQLLEIFVNSTLPYIISNNRTVVYWEDVFLDATINVSASVLPPENTILQTWNGGPNNTKKIVSSGYRAIVSSSDFYYLDCGHGGWLSNDSTYDQPPGTNQGDGGSWCAPFKTWQVVYNYDITYGLSKEEAKLVLGGEVALWSEQADPTVLDTRIWPRASAMAEALWSGNVDEAGNKRYAEATDRLDEWRHRMISRGVRAEPIQPLWCVKNPGMCNAQPI